MYSPTAMSMKGLTSTTTSSLLFSLRTSSRPPAALIATLWRLPTPIVERIARWCSINTVGYLQCLETRTEVYVVHHSEAWVFMSGADAQREVPHVLGETDGP